MSIIWHSLYKERTFMLIRSKNTSKMLGTRGAIHTFGILSYDYVLTLSTKNTRLSLYWFNICVLIHRILQRIVSRHLITLVLQTKYIYECKHYIMFGYWLLMKRFKSFRYRIPFILFCWNNILYYNMKTNSFLGETVSDDDQSSSCLEHI